MVDWVVGGTFCFCGVFCLLIAIINTKRAKASLTWRSVQGRIISSDVDTIRSKSSEHAPYYEAKVEYEYNVADQTYNGKRIAFGHGGSGSEDNERALIWCYQVGATVDVFYNPASPAEAVLERRTVGSNERFYFLGIAFILFGIALGLLL